MVLLTMTAALVAAVKDYNAIEQQKEETFQSSEPPLQNPMLGNPISHGQILDIAKALKTSRASPDKKTSSLSYNLDDLLRGSHIYTPPPPPKPEPVRSTTNTIHKYPLY